jgi:hypothetical protein
MSDLTIKRFQTELMTQSHRELYSKDGTDLYDTTFNGAAIVDAEGREIPITEAMIQHALRVLEQESLPNNDQRSRHGRSC